MNRHMPVPAPRKPALPRHVQQKMQQAESLYQKGLPLHRQGKLKAALAYYEKALQLMPRHAATLHATGLIYSDTGAMDAAVEYFQKAIAAAPGDGSMHYNFGNTLQRIQRYTQALQQYSKAIELNPRHWSAYINRGILYQEMKDPAHALADFETVLAGDPKNVSARHYSGTALIDLRRFDAGMQAFELALAQQPDNPHLLYNLAKAHNHRNEPFVAMGYYDRLLQIAPGFPFDYGSWMHTRMYLCDWREYEACMQELKRRLATGGHSFSALPIQGLIDDPMQQLHAARAWAADEFAAQAETLGPLPSRAPQAGQRIKVGYFSSDFCNHAVSFLSAELFELHDRSRFEVYAFALDDKDDDAMRLRLKAGFDHFLACGSLSDQQLAERIRALGIDILVDLQGYTHGFRPRVLAMRAAPVQCCYLGMLGTMGMDYIDYVIGDGVLITPDTRAAYGEKVISLPWYQVNDRKRPRPSHRPDRAECGLPEQGLVLACFNNTYKYNPPMFALWVRILQAVPGSVLWLYSSHAIVNERLQQAAAAAGLDPARLVFTENVEREQYLARYALVDLFLDTTPYNAGTTGSDALWMGTPVLTLKGRSMAARMAASLLTALGMPELIATTADDYCNIAIRLATHPEELQALRQQVNVQRERACLFDTPRFTRYLEQAYELAMARVWQQLPPEDITLTA